MNSILKLINVKKVFTQNNIDLEILHNVSVIFEQGKSYAIMGASGSGKSTLMHLISGIEIPTSGSILFNDFEINNLKQSQKDIFLNKSIGLVFQESFLIKELSVIENVMIKGLIQGQDYVECKNQAIDLLSRINLLDKSDCFPNTLSGGQQQRVAILRAIFNKPKFLLADEPTGNLDEKTGRDIINFLVECKKTWSMGLIISTHDQYIANKTEKIFELKNRILI